MFTAEESRLLGQALSQLLLPEARYAGIAIRREDSQPVSSINNLPGEVLASLFPTVSLVAAGGGNPGQARIPKGAKGGGQWTDTPSGMLERLREVNYKMVMDQTVKDRADLNVIEEQLPQYVKSALEGKTYGDGFHVEMTRMRVYGSGISFDGQVINKQGFSVGEFKRRLNYDSETGEYVVHHDWMKLQANERGKGFSTDFSKQSEAMYREMGVARIELTAALDDGGYAWARAGYEWQTGHTGYVKLNTKVLDDLVMQAGNEGRESDLDYLLSLVGNSNDKNYDALPHPAELAGWTDSTGNHLGDDILRGSVWEGVKRLDAPALTASISHPWYSSREREELLYAFCFENGLDIDAVWPPEYEAAWVAIDNPPTVTASGNPDQIRIPLGNPRGGQWTETIGKILVDVRAKMPKDFDTTNPLSHSKEGHEMTEAEYTVKHDAQYATMTDTKALTEYIGGGGYKDINGYLRDGVDRPVTTKDEDGVPKMSASEAVERIDRNFAEHGDVLTEPLKVWRGGHFPPGRSTSPGYTSVSINEGIAEFFTTVSESKEKPFRVIIPPGVKVLYGAADEGEIILPRDSVMEYIGVDENGFRVARVVPPNE